jgi:hypothetical protein
MGQAPKRAALYGSTHFSKILDKGESVRQKNALTYYPLFSITWQNVLQHSPTVS